MGTKPVHALAGLFLVGVLSSGCQNSGRYGNADSPTRSPNMIGQHSEMTNPQTTVAGRPNTLPAGTRTQYTTPSYGMQQPVGGTGTAGTAGYQQPTTTTGTPAYQTGYSTAGVPYSGAPTVSPAYNQPTYQGRPMTPLGARPMSESSPRPQMQGAGSAYPTGAPQQTYSVPGNSVPTMSGSGQGE